MGANGSLGGVSRFLRYTIGLCGRVVVPPTFFRRSIGDAQLSLTPIRDHVQLSPETGLKPESQHSNVWELHVLRRECLHESTLQHGSPTLGFLL